MATMEHVETRQVEGRESNRDVEREEKAITGGSVLEMVAGAGAIALPIIGLANVYPSFLASIAFIAIGGGMMAQGGGLSMQARSNMPGARSGNPEAVGVVGGMSAEILGGAAVIALGILALVRVIPEPLMAIAAIVAGGSLVLSAGNTARLSSYRYGAAHKLDDTGREILRQSVNAAAGADVLAGLAAIVLGIIALTSAGSWATQNTLNLVAALSLGGALFLNGTAVGARMAALLSS
jgi:hypothetical protein